MKEPIIMVAAHNLVTNAEQTHQTLTALLDTAAATDKIPDERRKGYEYADTFLAATARHLEAVESVLLPATRRHLADGKALVRAYVRAMKYLEIALVKVKAREHHSAYAMTMRWEDIWSAARARLDEHSKLELELSRRLSAELDDAELGELLERLRQTELHASARPHPHSPHVGMRGRIARRVLHAFDSFLDSAEGRMIPEQERPQPKNPDSRD